MYSNLLPATCSLPLGTRVPRYSFVILGVLSDVVSKQGLCHCQPNNSTHDFSHGSGRNGCLVMALVRGVGCVWCHQNKGRMMYDDIGFLTKAGDRGTGNWERRKPK